MFGPFVHALNKGGLPDILGNQRLLSTEAASIAGGSAAVRAHRGSWEDVARRLGWLIKPDSAKQYVEFLTFHAPRLDGHPTEARWDISDGEYLAIQVLRVLDGTGAIVHGSHV